MKDWKKPELVELDVGETLGGVAPNFPESFTDTFGGETLNGAS